MSVTSDQEERILPITDDRSLLTEAVFAWKGHEIVAVPVLQREPRRSVNRHKSTILFFVRVNQVLVRLWARAM